jgi:uncharacterized protein (DUF2267 family)
MPALERLERRVAAGLAFPAEASPRHAVIATLGALVDRLTAGEAHALLSGLPPAVGELLAERVLRREGQPIVPLDRAEFLLHVAAQLSVTPAWAEVIARAVFEAIRPHLPQKVVDGVAGQLPHGLKELWRSVAPARARPDTPSGPDEARRQVMAEIEANGALPEGLLAADAFEAVMCLLSGHLSGGEARDVLLSLPQSLQPLVTRCVLHRGEQAAVFDSGEFLSRLADHLGTSIDRAEQTARAVFGATKRVLPPKEVRDVAGQLPPDLRVLWALA